MRKVSPALNAVSVLYDPDSRTSATPDCRRMAKLMSAAPVPMPPEPRPTNRSVPDSGATNSSAPVDAISSAETALASGQPPQPAVFCTPLPVAVMLIRLIHETPLPMTGGSGAGDGAGAGI